MNDFLFSFAMLAALSYAIYEQPQTQLGRATVVMDMNGTVQECSIVNHAEGIPFIGDFTQRHEECHCKGIMDELECNKEAVVGML